MSKNPMRVIFAAVGLISFGLGTLGVVVPILPTVPLYMLTLFCFAKSSKRLHDWFTGTNLYKTHLEGFVRGQGMTLKTKITVMGTVTLLMAVGLICMKEVPAGRIILTVVWICHVLYFVFGVKTRREEQK